MVQEYMRIPGTMFHIKWPHSPLSAALHQRLTSVGATLEEAVLEQDGGEYTLRRRYRTGDRSVEYSVALPLPFKSRGDGISLCGFSADEVLWEGDEGNVCFDVVREYFMLPDCEKLTYFIDGQPNEVYLEKTRGEFKIIDSISFDNTRPQTQVCTSLTKGYTFLSSVYAATSGDNCITEEQVAEYTSAFMSP
jgi:hypothetical protein